MERLPDTLQKDGTITAHFRDEKEGTHLSIQITYEGLILEAWSIDEDGNDFTVGILGRKADAWWDYIKGSGG